jgi:hypothetical protein
MFRSEGGLTAFSFTQGLSDNLVVFVGKINTLDDFFLNFEAPLHDRLGVVGLREQETKRWNSTFVKVRMRLCPPVLIAGWPARWPTMPEC